MSEVRDDDLVRRALAGEPHAFEQLVAKHQRLVFGVALSGARDVAAAEDVAQEAFVEAWRDLPRLREPARVGSWIAGIARNLARSWARRSSRRQRREQVTVAVANELAPTPLDSALDRETQSLVRAALEQIPAAYREALVLFYVQGQSVAEVASGLGITEDAAKQRLSRGRRALRSSIEARVEGALEQLGPSKSFTAAVMAAVATTTARRAAAASAGKAFVGMKATKTTVVVALALVITGGAAWYVRSPAAAPRAAVAGAAASPHAIAAHEAHAAAVSVHKLRGRTREELIAAIRNAERLASTAPAPAPMHVPNATPPPALPAGSDDNHDDPDGDYIQEAMKALAPTIGQCYREALKTQPTLAGKLVLSFTIEGEPEVGGVVTESAVDVAQSEIKDPGLTQCVQDTLFDLEIDPPANAGKVKVTYPFTFWPKN